MPVPSENWVAVWGAVSLCGATARALVCLPVFSECARMHVMITPLVPVVRILGCLRSSVGMGRSLQAEMEMLVYL
jgi:hypothetical protein